MAYEDDDEDYQPDVIDEPDEPDVPDEPEPPPEPEEPEPQEPRDEPEVGAAPSEDTPSEDTWKPYEEPAADQAEEEQPLQQFAAADTGVKSDAGPQKPAAKEDTWKPYEDPDAKKPAEAKEDTWKPYDPNKPEAEGTLMTIGRKLLHYAAPTAAAIGTGVVTAPAGPWVSIPAGIAAFMGVHAAQEKGLEVAGISDAEQQRINAEANPKSDIAADVIAAAIPFGVGTKAALGQRTLGAGIGTALEGYGQVREGHFDPTRLAIGAATGAVFNQPRAGTLAFERMVGAQAGRVTGRPDLYPPPGAEPAPPGAAAGVEQPGVKNRDWTGPPANVPEPTPPAQGQVRGTEPGPQEALNLPEPTKPIPPERNLPLEPAPTVNREGQLGFNVTAPHGTGLTSRSAMPDTGGVAKEAIPPSTGRPNTTPHSAERYGKEAQLRRGVSSESGINVLQPGQGDPAVNYGLRHRTGQEGAEGNTFTVTDPAFARGKTADVQVERNPTTGAVEAIQANNERHVVPTVYRGQAPEMIIARMFGSHPYRANPDVSQVKRAAAPTEPPQRTVFEPPRPPAAPPARPEPLPREQSLTPYRPTTTQGVMTEPPVPRGTTRMYQGERAPPREFSTDRKVAERYGPARHVDITGAEAQHFQPGRMGHPEFVTDNPIYRQRARPTEATPTEPVRRTGAAEPARAPPTGERTASPQIDAMIKQALAQPVPAARAPAAAAAAARPAETVRSARVAPGAVPASREATWRVKGGDRKVRVSPIPAKKEGYTRITYKGKDYAVPNNQVVERPAPKGKQPSTREGVEQATGKHGGLERATGALQERIARQVEDIKAGRLAPDAARTDVPQRLAITRQEMNARRGAAAAKPAEPPKVKTHDGAVFTGATIHEAAVRAKAGGYRPHQIFKMDGSVYQPPKAGAAATTPPTTPPKAATTPPGATTTPPKAATTPPPKGPTPLGGAPTPPGYAAKFRDYVTKITDEYKRTFDPSRISEHALKAKGPARESRAYFEGEKFRITEAGLKHEKMWNAVPEQARLKAMDDYQNGRPISDPKLKAYFDTRFRPEMAKAHKAEAEQGSTSYYRDNYISQEWNRPKGNQPPIGEHFKSMGPTWFQKARTFEIIAEGYRAGYTLRSTNPEVILRSRLIAGADMRSKMELLHDWNKMGLAAHAAADETAAKNALDRIGWQELSAPDRKKWMIAPDVQTIWKNGIEAKGLWAMDNIYGDAFRGWMAFKAVWVPLRLAFSGFHALHVAHINMNTNLARASKQLRTGDPAGALKSLSMGLQLRSQKGIEGRQQWATPEYLRSEQGKMDVRHMEEGGFVPMVSRELQTGLTNKFKEAMADRSFLKVGYYGARSIGQMAPMFEMWIPHLKTAAYLNDVAAELKRRPDLMTNEVQRKAAFNAIAESIDNRFGEMFYGGLFWNRYVKDTSIGSFLSLGWNLGFAREFLGAGIEAGTRPAGKLIPGMKPSETRQTIHDATNKMEFAALYMGTAAAIGGMMTYLFTGEAPKEINDYIFPRVGGVNPDGSPRRLTTMAYTREIPMLMKHVEEKGGVGTFGGGLLSGAWDMVWNKMLFQPFKEIYDNRSYFGKEIYDTNAPGYEKLMQTGKHILGEQLSPMSVSGAKRSQETGGALKEIPLALLGFGPAPKYAEADAMQNRIGALYREHVSPGARAYEDEANTKEKLQVRNDILIAQKKDDQQGLQKAIEKGYELGMKPAYVKSILKGESGDQKMFRQLPVSDQTHLLNSGSKAQVERYLPFAKKETRQKWYTAHPP